MGVAIEGWMFRMKLLNLIEKTVKTKSNIAFAAVKLLGDTEIPLKLYLFTRHNTNLIRSVSTAYTVISCSL